jgi:hypothetical protein
MVRGAEEKTHSSSGAEKGITKVLELGRSGHFAEWPPRKRDGLKWRARSIEEIAGLHGNRQEPRERQVKVCTAAAQFDRGLNSRFPAQHTAGRLMRRYATVRNDSLRALLR